MENKYRPTRLDHFPNTEEKPQPQRKHVGTQDGLVCKRKPHPGSGDTLKMWLEAHNLPFDGKHPHINVRTMARATGGRP